MKHLLNKKKKKRQDTRHEKVEETMPASFWSFCKAAESNRNRGPSARANKLKGQVLLKISDSNPLLLKLLSCSFAFKASNNFPLTALHESLDFDVASFLKDLPSKYVLSMTLRF